MSNYLSQIAARNTGPQQPAMAPAHAAVDIALNDPFNSAAIAPNETGQVIEGTPTATITPSAGREVMAPAQLAGDPFEKTTTTEQQAAIKPVYLSKYIERNNYYTREHTNTVITKKQGSNDAIAAATESPAISIFPSVQSGTAASETATKQAHTPVKPDTVQQPNTIVTTELVPREHGNDSAKLPRTAEQPLVLQPITNVTQYDTKPALLQPQLPVQPAVTLQKEKPAPALVIGKITVEIVPAQKPVNKIINHVVKPQPTATPSTQRNKHSFGLGQL